MRITVLPRDAAARVVTSGISRGVWVVSSANLVMTFPILGEFMVERGRADALPLPFLMLALMLSTALCAAWRPQPWLAATFLAVGAACVVVYEVSLLSSYPAVTAESLFVLNRPAVSLVLVGVIPSTWVLGLVWVCAGFTVSLGASVTAAMLTGVPVVMGWGPLIILAAYTSIYSVLGAIQKSQRKLVPDFESLEKETMRSTVEEGLRSRMTAMVHDTLLNDLALVMNAPDVLDGRTVDRLGADIQTLHSPEWLRETEGTTRDESYAELRNRMVLMVNELQWRGLTVHITGSGRGVYRVSEEVLTALVEVTRACLENVLRHSGTDVAELDIAYTATEVSIVVSDEGVGFDPTTVADDRLGVRMSIVDRMTAAGGAARIWSQPGTGTSIVLSAPVLEVISLSSETSHD